VIIELRLSPDQSRGINSLPAGRSFGERQAPAGKVPTVGYLRIGPSQCKLAPRHEAFYQGLRDWDYVPRQNTTVDRRCSARTTKCPSEFVDRRVNVIFVGAPRTGARPVPKMTS
jgi:hypothetical protein